jgi:GAF domain-containing protein
VPQPGATLGLREKPGENALEARRRKSTRGIAKPSSTAALKKQLDDALEQQAATAELLTVMSRSAFELQPVLDNIVSTASRLCDAEFAIIFKLDKGKYHVAASNNADEVFVKYASEHPIAPGRGSLIGRTALEGKTVHLPDCLADPEYTFVEYQQAGKYRSDLGVPLLRDGVPIGVIALMRTTVKPFTDKEIALVETFASQAVIAIENARLLGELRESLQQQTTTSEILEVISNSPTDTQPAFDAIVRSGLKLFPDAVVVISLPEGDSVKLAAIDGANQHDREALRARYPLPLSREYITSTAILDRREMDFADARETPEHLIPGGRNFLASGYRAIAAVPMIRGESSIGAISVLRRQPGALSEKQRELLRTFASQAVIAIENTRLFTELRQRTDDLSESLEQQTATSEVLKVISNSQGQVEPVFNAMLENATRICGAKFGTLYLCKGDAFYAAAFHNAPAEFIEARKNRPLYPPSESTLGRAARTKQAAQILDSMQREAYRQRDPFVVAGTELGGYRTIVSVPMLKDDELIGAISIYRQEVRPFTDKQIELVKNFASQAVIAIENARLLNEVRESLQQQTATADVLKVISSSPGELKPVFDAMLANASRICDASYGAMWLQDGNEFRNAAFHGPLPSAYTDQWQSGMVFDPGSHNPMVRASKTRKPLQIADMREDRAYRDGHPLAVAGVDIAGIRTLVAVPMLKDNELAGVIAIYRKEVRPFTEKQIELVQNFAAQAVIAIENTRLLNELRQRTNDLTESLNNLRATQDRLVQTQKLASLGQLTAGIAHEMKNPLNFVNNFSTLTAELIDELQDTLKGLPFTDRARTQINELTHTLRDNLDKIVHHGRRADAIVKNMLLHSREASSEHRRVDINAIVEESLNMAWHGARAEKQGFSITIERSFDPAAGEADVFPQEITRALLNLISNAFYAANKRKGEAGSDRYKPTLVASTRSRGDRVEIGIRDNGTGIPPNVKEKMFDPFFTTKPAGEGTGLGLSISHDIIVKQHAGSIEVDTQPGEFTEFRIILPRIAASP